MKKTINRSSGMVLLAGAAVLWSATAAGPVAACIQGKNKAADKRAKCLFKAESFGPTAVPAASFYWSSTSDASIPNDAWLVVFSDGYVNIDGKEVGLFVRAVRGGR